MTAPSGRRLTCGVGPSRRMTALPVSSWVVTTRRMSLLRLMWCSLGLAAAAERTALVDEMERSQRGSGRVGIALIDKLILRRLLVDDVVFEEPVLHVGDARRVEPPVRVARLPFHAVGEIA